ncbi:hypothetical protein DSO57_1017747 [Entomophthora muscae]|uniref:Uncharacterized protein n=1 Tax=Entomophthora muscae TaxID=34485 RepID=A0ACC2URI3_9FUNG|nr:hypothetical protein DSO57_1017747 [Entomophthora muscae]
MEKPATGVYYILVSVVLERSCFFGIRNLLNVYLKAALGLAPHEAKSQVHLFVGLVYAFPLIGAMVSDSFLGKYRTILALFVLYLTGASLLALFSANGVLAQYGEYPLWGYYVPALLISMGAGGMMPCMVSHGGDQIKDPVRLEGFFSTLYLGMSIGSLFGQYLTPYLKEYTVCFGSECYFGAYGASVLLLGMACTIFLLGRRQYVKTPAPQMFLPWHACCLSFYAFQRYLVASPEERRIRGSILSFACDRYSPEFVRETQLIWRITTMFVPLVFAWMLYDQSSTEWQNQYERMDKNFLGLVLVPTEASTNINYVLVIFMVPFISQVVYPFLGRRVGHIKDTSKLLMGFLFIILAFVVSICLDLILERFPCSEGRCLNGAWQLPQWVLLAIGEAILSPIVYQFSYTEVGPKLKSCASSLSLLSVAIGNYVIVLAEHLFKDIKQSAIRQSIYVLIATIALIVLYLLTRFWYVSKRDEDVKADLEVVFTPALKS